MRFTLDLEEPKQDEPSTPEWVPLQSHPVFTSSIGDVTSSENLLAWDGASRLYYWDSNKHCLHRITIRFGDPDTTSVFACTSSKVLVADEKIEFVVTKILINRNGSALILSGNDDLRVMYLYGRVMYLYGRSSSKDNAIVCRTVSVGSQIYFNDNNVIRTLQVLWHPCSDTHLGILSSDSVFRIFDFSSDVLQPEQEYYLQPVEQGRSQKASSICPIHFSFGGDHLWDRFSVFVLFGDGSVYILCPVAPFGSIYKWESISEIYTDAHTFGLTSSNPTAVNNSSLAISWLEATFPELCHEEVDRESLSSVKAQPYALFNASLCLQGPLKKVSHGRENDDAAAQSAECEGCAVSFLYNLVSKDSILVTSFSGGQLQIDALADEIQPVWSVGSAPRLRVKSHDQILGLAMICESTTGAVPLVKLDQPLDHTVWLGHPPPLLRLAIVDLALPRRKEGGYSISMVVDTLMPERIYCLHDGGIDSIVFHFLPFTSQSNSNDETARSPSVRPVLSTCQAENSPASPLCAFVALSDSFGCSWVVGITSTQECIVLEMKTWNLLLPMHIDVEEKPSCPEELRDNNPPDIISKELLSGPKVVLFSQTSPNLRSVAADSIEGRSSLHEYFKLFHENYVEYAQKVYFEVKHHPPQLKRIIDDQHTRITEAQDKLLKVEEKLPGLEDRIDRAVHQHDCLEKRLQSLRNLPGAYSKRLSRAERQFKAELDQLAEVELDALRTSIETLRARLRRYAKSKEEVKNQRKQISGNNYSLGAQISQLKSSIEKQNGKGKAKEAAIVEDSSEDDVLREALKKSKLEQQGGAPPRGPGGSSNPDLTSTEAEILAQSQQQEKTSSLVQSFRVGTPPPLSPRHAPTPKKVDTAIHVPPPEDPKLPECLKSSTSSSSESSSSVDVLKIAEETLKDSNLSKDVDAKTQTQTEGGEAQQSGALISDTNIAPTSNEAIVQIPEDTNIDQNPAVKGTPMEVEVQTLEVALVESTSGQEAPHTEESSGALEKRPEDAQISNDSNIELLRRLSTRGLPLDEFLELFFSSQLREYLEKLRGRTVPISVGYEIDIIFNVLKQSLKGVGADHQAPPSTLPNVDLVGVPEREIEAIQHEHNAKSQALAEARRQVEEHKLKLQEAEASVAALEHEVAAIELRRHQQEELQQNFEKEKESFVVARYAFEIQRMTRETFEYLYEFTRSQEHL